MNDSNFVQNLVLVTSYGRSVSDVCRRAGINRQQYNRYLSGQSSPNLSTLRRICDFFGLEDHEIFLDHSTFSRIIRLRPPMFKNTEDPVSEYVRKLYLPDRNEADPLKKYEGYYHCYMAASEDSQQFLRTLVSVRHNGRGWVTKSLERYPRSTFTIPNRMKYEGIIYYQTDRLIMMEQEIFSRKSTWTTTMYTTDFERPTTLSGLSMGIAPESSHDIVCFRIVWEFLGKEPNLRTAVQACGLLEKSDKSIPSMLTGNAENMMIIATS